MNAFNFNLPWLDLNQIYARYFNDAIIPATGEMLKDAISRAEQQKFGDLQEIGIFGEANCPELVARVRQIEEYKAIARTMVIRMMRDGGQGGDWVAVGRKALTAPDELISPEYWRLLDFDFDSNSCGADEIRYRGLKCIFLVDVPRDHPMRETLLYSKRAQPISTGKSPLAGQNECVDVTALAGVAVSERDLDAFLIRFVESNFTAGGVPETPLVHAAKKHFAPKKVTRDRVRSWMLKKIPGRLLNRGQKAVTPKLNKNS